MAERTERTAELVDQLHAIVRELEAMHPGRRFPLDGHLVGSIGEAAAEAMFRIALRPSSTAGHDAIADDGRLVEIKATYGKSTVGIRDTSHANVAALIVLRLSRVAGVPHEIVYNGSLMRVMPAVGLTQRNGQGSISLARLRSFNVEVPDSERIATR